MIDKLTPLKSLNLIHINIFTSNSHRLKPTWLWKVELLPLNPSIRLAMWRARATAGSSLCSVSGSDNTNRTNWAFIQSIRKYGELQRRGNERDTDGRDSLGAFSTLPHLWDSDQVCKTLYKRWELPGEYLNYCWILPVRIN